MAGRQNKVGLDYFELDCHMDEKVRLIQAEYGLKGFAVFVKLLQSIYGEHGYYCEWTQDTELLFASENGLNNGSLQLLRDIVSACIRRNIFSERLLKEYGILTSSGVQKQYLKATVKREVVELKKEYLLISVPKNRKNVVINSISDGRNSISVGRNEQRRVEKSREENKNTMCKADACALFEKLWKLYPNKRGKGQVSVTAKQRLLKIGYEEMSRAIERYMADLEMDSDWRKPQNGSTFFNSGYVDYLDSNYKKPDPPKKNKSSQIRFNNFKQREYDIGALEKELLGYGLSNMNETNHEKGD